jgi:pyruvate dehydrogenase E2 component (dihydrolipoamide acetyltransferase)
MATDVVMPQMGESIFEGTVTKWLKKPGDTVARDEPLFEISTDKLDAENPSPIAGTLQEIKVEAGATVQVNVVVAVIGEGAGAAAAAAAPSEADAVPAEPENTGGTPDAGASTASATEVVMPQMGESIFEGTITKWLKKVGDKVERDEPLFEISTDKVDAEIPAPIAGVLQEIRAEAGATVQVNTTVALIGGAAAASGAAASSGAAVAQPAKGAPAAIEGKPSPVPSGATTPFAAATIESGEKLRSSPLVRKMAKENDLDLRQIAGTGSAGRITKEDVLGYMEKGEKGAATAPPAAAAAQSTPAPSAPQTTAAPQAKSPAPAPVATSTLAGQVVPMSRMRSIIAQRMVQSKQTNAHVHTVFKIDMTRIVRLREKEKNKYEQRIGVKLTYMPFIARAVTATLRKMPIINASIEGDAIRYHGNVNLGIAVALEWGLIVPVIKQAEERSFLGVARAIADLAERARGKKLKPDEVGTSTFTLTNAGIYGEQFGTPVINMPESAILGIGGLFKEPAVVTDELGSDSIAIRHVIHLTLGFDHRIIDGSDAGKFMAEVKKYLEGWNEDIG